MWMMKYPGGLISRALLGALTKRPAWAGFRAEKQVQRKKLAELGSKVKDEARRVKAEARAQGGGRGPAAGRCVAS